MQKNVVLTVPYLSSMYAMPKDTLSEDAHAVMSRRLTIPKISMVPTGAPETLSLMHEDADFIFVPRFLGVKAWGAPDTVNLSWATSGGTMVFNGRLDESRGQPGAVRDVMQHFEKDQECPPGAILVLPCGFGKTCCALKIACDLGRRTLIVVPTRVLADQWADRISFFCPRSRHCTMSGAQTIESLEEMAEHEFVITTIQTLSMCHMPEEMRTFFGTAVIDEAHKLVAPTFQLAVRNIAPAFFLSLSATPERGDGLHIAMPFLLGDIVHRKARPPCNEMLVFRLHCPHGNLKEVKRTISGKVVYGTAKMITAMCKSDSRRKSITEAIRWCLRQQRTVLVLSDRVELLRNLYADMADNEAETGAVCGMLTGSTKQTDRASVMTMPVILATYGLCREGFDKASLNTLIMVTPVTNIEQCVGRILRGGQSCVSPLVIDIVDDFSVFRLYAKKRFKFYDKNRYQILEKKNTFFKTNASR
jgi:superfamily II DNA or RNA helicase